MRIIAGRWRGRRLSGPTGLATRPIPDRVKESLFDRLGVQLGTPGALPPVTVLDLFAGTGSLGLEALSRGAAFCCFVEKDRTAAAHLMCNIRTLGADMTCKAVVADALAVSLPRVAEGRRYDVVFLDPPYRLSRDNRPDGPVVRLLRRLGRADILQAGAVVILRHERRVGYEEASYGRLCCVHRREYGAMALTWLTLAEAPETPDNAADPPAHTEPAGWQCPGADDVQTDGEGRQE